MIGYTADTRMFDLWMISNYNNLLNYCNRYKIPEDTLNDTYLNIKNRILLSGYTGNKYMTFVKRSITNLRINDLKKENNRHYISTNNIDYQNEIESKLRFTNEMDNDSKQYQEDVMYLSRMIFKYIMDVKKIDAESLFIFRTYYLMNGKMTYKKLTVMTGINKNRCTKIIQTIKSDIRQNFLEWLKSQDKYNYINN